jgi:3-oxoacyl-[acyl-carrier protein] reductase
VSNGNQVAIITGAGGGIGRGIALQLVRAGWTIVVNDIGGGGEAGAPSSAEVTLQQVRAAGGQGIVVLADITCKEDRERLVQQTLDAYGRIDLLVNNAGIAPRQRVDMLETSEESMQEVLAVNLIGPFFLTQRVAQVMLELLAQGVIQQPRIINIGSVSAYAASTNRAEYCLSKAGVSMSTLLYAERLAEAGINVYEIRPGIIDTPMTAGVKDKYDRLIAAGITPIRRWGQPEDVGKAVVAIAEGYLPFSTGQVLDVDGGFHIQRL